MDVRPIISPYELAITEHFIEYVLYLHTKPIGSVIRDFLALRLFGHMALGNLIITSCADVLTSVFIYAILRLLSINRKVALISAVLFSLSMIGWEYWRLSSHFDHLNIFCFGVLAWAMSFHLKENTIKSALALSVSGGLVIFFHSMAIVIVPILLVACQRINAKPVQIAKFIMITGAIPILVIALVMGKNVYQFGVYGTSSVAGQNALQFVSQGDTKEIYELLDRNTYPEWWEWCFEYAGKVFPDSKLNAGIYGSCMYQVSDEGSKEYVSTPLENKLIELDESALLDIVRKDKVSVTDKSWLFVGGVHESASVFSIEYGKISFDLWRDWLVQAPQEFAIRFIGSSVRYFSGIAFLSTDIYEPQLKVSHSVIKVFGMIIMPLLILGIIRLIYIPLQALYGISNKTVNKLEICQNSSFYLFMLFALAFWMLFFITNLLTCCENSRMFMSGIVFPYILGVVTVVQANNFVRRILGRYK